jgi:rhodanese-related sulfurtransferase
MTADLPLETDVQTVKNMLERKEDFVLLDCREQEEFNFARIDGSTWIPMKEIPGRIDDLAEFRDKRVVVHCHHGGRSMRVAEWLRQQGFKEAQSMKGGIDAWAVEIDPATPRY